MSIKCIGKGAHNKGCYNCGQKGHLAAQCPTGEGPGEDQGKGKGNGNGRACVKSGIMGHIAVGCWKGQGSPQTTSRDLTAESRRTAALPLVGAALTPCPKCGLPQAGPGSCQRGLGAEACGIGRKATAPAASAPSIDVTIPAGSAAQCRHPREA